MTLSSYSDVFSINHDREYEEEIRVGDIVRTGENLFPHFQVMAVHYSRAWVRNTETGADFLTDVIRCRKINGQPVTTGAE